PEEHRDIVTALREADGELKGEKLSSQADARLQRLVAEGPYASRRSLQRSSLLGLSALAAVGVAALLWLLLSGREVSPPAHHADPINIPGLSVVSGRVYSPATDQVACAGARCVLNTPQLRVQLELRRGARVAKQGATVTLLTGDVRCSVKPRRKGEPLVAIHVSQGRIEVIGTLFDLHQQGDSGSVRLHEGVIRFVAADGRSVRLEKNAVLRWPLPAPVEAASVKASSVEAAPASKPAPLTAREIQALARRVSRLRNQNKYPQALRSLRLALPRIAHRATRERFSYELGVILTDHFKSKRACLHWRRHLRSFGRRRYGQEIDQAIARLRCQ
ncbi:MAG: FecR domain-containing protein, partial [Deltaproteobacteria bacterium]|nr:FecR domain-containing protein [Deltaproteobacteria bacterium]